MIKVFPLIDGTFAVLIKGHEHIMTHADMKVFVAQFNAALGKFEATERRKLMDSIFGPLMAREDA